MTGFFSWIDWYGIFMNAGKIFQQPRGGSRINPNTSGGGQLLLCRGQSRGGGRLGFFWIRLFRAIILAA
jgi:hypothetical protein